MSSVREQVAIYRQRGWYCVPLRPRSKSPARRDWTKLRLQPEVFPENSNIGIILGEPSGWLVDVDLDCPEAIELADQYLPPTSAITGRPSSARSHRWYVAVGASTEKHTDGAGAMIVELRSTGAQTVVGPSIHPSGEEYDPLDDEPANVPAPMLAACVKALADAVIVRRGGSVTPDKPTAPPVSPTDATDVETRAIAYLAAMPPAVSGSGGHSQTYAAATALVHGFGIDSDRALAILAAEYNPRCNPPWSEKELRHKVNQAATKPHDRPFGWLRNESLIEPSVDPVDLSAFMTKPTVVASLDEKSESKLPTTLDPGHLPERLFEVPGFVRRVMDFTLANAPYPNVGLAFCGAMALQSFLAGRKVATTGDLRTNIYLLALAGSGTGKEFPRKVNSQVLFQIGESKSIGDKFASGEGIQDALARSGKMLFQNDEMDGVLRQINLDRDNSRESIPNILLTLYTSAGDVYPLRVKANQKDAIHVDQPHLTLFGTATPQHFYESLSKRMLTNGFFARLNIIDVGKRGKGQTPGSARNLPDAILDVAKWWADFEPGGGNFMSVHPKPSSVPFTGDAETAITELREQTEIEYDKADDAGDEVARTAWSRTCEHAKKLALIYACSENHVEPKITLAAVRWASEFALHQARRQLYLASVHVAENPFHAECLRLKKRLSDRPDRTMARREIMRSMTLKAHDFDQVILTLMQQEEIEPVTIQTKTKPAQGYRLIEPAEIRQ
ncbi:bifunctional DNA primase/polymerase [Roseiconus lacunae]|uniref:bifunctional DNA primase/polymerase n=1 Tax=Roseiconus lacunae TaxID=2605694 RepID=UPI001E53D826|nr:bifunctional DNA primase/polymerase [Roseiconus lacunae]MCD0462285.1 bifunctional DNA primase/polymerase [Roseiconus lacunae]